jgi:hypothetical protein
MSREVDDPYDPHVFLKECGLPDETGKFEKAFEKDTDETEKGSFGEVFIVTSE